MKRTVAYLSYLLRLWRDDPDAPWHVSLEEAHTSERRYFRDADQMVDFLCEQMKRGVESMAEEDQRSKDLK